MKSTAVKALFDPWFSDELADLGSKDAAMQTKGVWGIEVSELDAMSRMDVSRIKPSSRELPTASAPRMAAGSLKPALLRVLGDDQFRRLSEGRNRAAGASGP